MQCPAIDNVMVRSTRPFSFIQKKNGRWKVWEQG